MDLSLDRDPLFRALQLATPLLDSRTTLPILSHVLLETTELGLRLTATDLEVGVRVTVPGEVRAPGALTVPARPFAELVRALPAGPVALATPKPDAIRVSSGNAEVRLASLPAEDYPPLETPQEGRELVLEAERLQRMLAQTSFATARDWTRRALTGVLVSVAGEELRLAATDGHRLALAREGIEPGPAAVGLMPGKAVSAMARLLDHQETVTLRLSATQLALQAGAVRLVSKLLEGLPFPNYEQVLPKEFARRVITDREAFIAAVRRVAVLAETDTRTVRLTLREDALHLAASSPELGDAEDTVPAQGAGEDVAIGFNARYLLEALAPMEGHQVVMEFGDPRSPAAFSSATDDRYRCLIMPLAP